MKKLKQILEETVKPIELNIMSPFKKFLTEEDDFSGDDAGGSDPFSDAPVGGDALGADDDPFATGGDAAGSETAGEDDSNNDTNNADDEGDDKKSLIDDDSHEDDPDFTLGATNDDDVTLSSSPAGKMIYDTEKVMNTVATIIQTLKDTELIEIEKVKTAIELVFNGKKLKDEDLEFTNLKNAIFLIKKIGAKLDIKTRSYLYRKIKEPLIKKRDQIKQDIAVQKGQLQNTRDVLTAMDVK